MADTAVFDQLVKSLDSEERRNLLSKLLSQEHVSQEPLKKDPDEEQIVDLDAEYGRLGLLQKFFIMLRSIFTGKDRFSVLEAMLRRGIEIAIEHRSPGLMAFRRDMFTEKMHEEILGLKDGLQTLRAPLDLAMRRDRQDFVAFFAGVKMGAVQTALMEATDPERIWNGKGDLDSGAVKADLLRQCDEVTEQIPRDERRAVYYDIQALSALARLSVHPYNTMLACFHKTSSGEERYCDFSELSRYLASMADVLSTAQYPPTETALRAVFLFSYKDQLLDPTFSLEDHLETDLHDAEAALETIRGFNARVPVTSILKYITHNLGYRPKATGGGEDWFVIYKNFWTKRAASNYARFYRHHKEELLSLNAARFLGFRRLPPLVHYRPEQFENLAILRHSLSLSFLKGFFHKIFRRTEKTLQIILTSGDFYKAENRRELNDSIAYLGLIDENLTALESRLNPEGDLGKLLAEAKNERKSPVARVRRIGGIAEHADRNASYLVGECYKKLSSLSQVLDGVLHGKSAERYDTLANIGSLGGVGNKLLVSTWNEALEQIRGGLNILREIRALEEGPPP